MRSLENDFGDAGLLCALSRIKLINGESDDIPLVQIDVIEGKILPAPGVGEAELGDSFAIEQERHCFDAGVGAEFLECADHSVGDGDSIERDVAALFGEMLGDAEFDALSGAGRLGDPGRHGIVIAEFPGRFQRGSACISIPEEGAAQGAATHELLKDRGADFGMQQGEGVRRAKRSND